MAHDVFISYSSKDKPTADAVCAMLELNGVRCWIAPRDVTPGMEWGECIIDAIEECRIMVLVFTADADSSPQIRREVERAVNHSVAILPFRIENVLPGKALEYFIGNVHWLDALTTPMETHLKSLAGTVKMLLARTAPHDATSSGIGGRVMASVPSESDMPEEVQPIRQNHVKAGEPVFASPAHAPEVPRAAPSPAVAGGLQKPLTQRLWIRVLMGVAALLVLYIVVSIIQNGSGTATKSQENSAPIGQPDAKNPANPPQTQPTAKSTANTGEEKDWGSEEFGAVRAAANTGDPKAQLELGHRYFFGREGASKDYSQALIWYHKAADQGVVGAEVNLGVMYAYGKGVPLDFAQAISWYRKAAEQGDSDAEVNLGVLYAEGHGVPQDFAQAASWYRKAADQGNATAQDNLGYFYQHGEGVPQDFARALALYHKAADQGEVGAYTNLGVMYGEGQGVPKDYSKALFWYQKAADQGDEVAQFDLGVFYQNGFGVQKDLAQARMWYQKAADQGYDDAKRSLARLNGQN